MRIDEARPAIEYLMQLGMVPMLVGEAGIGKTEIIKRIGEETGRQVIVLMLSQMEPGDLLGLPTRDEKEQITVYYKPDWWPKTGQSIVFLDEINRAHVTVRHAVMQLLIDKRIHNNVLPEGTWLVAAMNPENENYEVESVIDKAFIDRFVWIKLTNDLEDWIKFMAVTKRAEFKFLKAVENVAKISRESFMFGRFELPELSPTPRSLERLGKIITNCPNSLRKHLEELALGVCGKVALKIVQEYVNLVEAGLGYNDLLEGNVEAVKQASAAERVAALNSALTYLLSKFDATAEVVRVEEQIIDNIAECLKHYKREELGPLFRYTSQEYRNLIMALKKFKSFAQFFTTLIRPNNFKAMMEKLG